MPKRPAAKRPSEVFADRMRKARERKGWSQQDMADRLAEMGEPTDRATLARTETRARGLSLDDAMAYAAALGASFTHMVCPLDNAEPVALASKLVLPSRQVRDWIKHGRALRPEDSRTVVLESPDEEWMARQHVYLNVILDRVQALVDAVVDDERDAVDNITDAINDALEKQRAEMKERQR